MGMGMDVRVYANDVCKVYDVGILCDVYEGGLCDVYEGGDVCDVDKACSFCDVMYVL